MIFMILPCSRDVPFMFRTSTHLNTQPAAAARATLLERLHGRREHRRGGSGRAGRGGLQRLAELAEDGMRKRTWRCVTGG